MRERERFETEWIRNRTAIVVPALEEIKALLNKACWQCEVRPDKDQGIHFTIYRENMKAGIGAGGSERPYMSFQPEKVKNTVLVYVATIGSGAGLGSFALDQITEDFVQAEWGISSTNRRVRIYQLTAAGGKHLEREVSSFERMLKGISQVLAPGEL